MPLEVTLDNILTFEKIINLECFILNNKVTYLLRIPITYPNTFNYFHLYSIPVLRKSLFKVIIPPNKFLLKNKLHYAYRSQECQEVKAQSYVCDKMDLQEITEDSPCTVQLLDNPQYTSTCQQIEVKITKPIIKQLDTSDQWIFILPKKEIMKLRCDRQEESQKLIGTYMLQIPEGCQASLNQESIINNRKAVSNHSQPILFPDFDEIKLLPTLNLSVRLQEIELDGLYKLEKEIQENQPELFFSNISGFPSAWTLLIYALLIICASFYFYRKRCFFVPNKSNLEPPGTVELQDVQLPR